jgi:hypothetical protein
MFFPHRAEQETMAHWVDRSLQGALEWRARAVLFGESCSTHWQSPQTPMVPTVGGGGRGEGKLYIQP